MSAGREDPQLTRAARPGSDDGSEPPVEHMQPSAELRRRVLAAADPATRFEGFVERVGRLFDVSRADARELLESASRPTDASWGDGFSPGMRLFHLQGGESVAEADCGFVELRVGAEVPRHRHGGVEQVLVLSGRAEEDCGEIWRPGDWIVRPGGSVHGFRSTGREPLLFAVVLRDGLELVRDDLPERD